MVEGEALGGIEVDAQLVGMIQVFDASVPGIEV